MFFLGPTDLGMGLASRISCPTIHNLTALPEKMTIKPSLKKQNKVKPVQEAQVNFQLQITSRK